MMDISLTNEQLARWQTDHYLVVRGGLTSAQTVSVAAWTDDMARWADIPMKWMRYYEANGTSQQLCRMENFLPYHDGMRNLICGGGTMSILDALMGEPACLFKEKINFKYPGGSGFTAHQDAPAFITFGQRYHITMLVAVDEQNAANGGLEMSSPVELYKTLPQDAGGALDPETEASLPWSPLSLQAGDMVFFDSYIPHRSGLNRSTTSRRALYVTYNRASEGDRRSAYFEHKRRVFPPPCERLPGVDYSSHAAIYNVGNPIR